MSAIQFRKQDAEPYVGKQVKVTFASKGLSATLTGKLRKIDGLTRFNLLVSTGRGDERIPLRDVTAIELAPKGSK